MPDTQPAPLDPPAEHFSADDYPVLPGKRFWSNDLRVVEIAPADPERPLRSAPYADTGETATWHKTTTAGSYDTLTGWMRKYGRLGRFAPEGHSGLDAEDYPVGTQYRDVKT
jgi:hypothetical protein